MSQLIFKHNYFVKFLFSTLPLVTIKQVTYCITNNLRYLQIPIFFLLFPQIKSSSIKPHKGSHSVQKLDYSIALYFTVFPLSSSPRKTITSYPKSINLHHFSIPIFLLIIHLFHYNKIREMIQQQIFSWLFECCK